MPNTEWTIIISYAIGITVTAMPIIGNNVGILSVGSVIDIVSVLNEVLSFTNFSWTRVHLISFVLLSHCAASLTLSNKSFL